jgi:glucokinase
LLDMPREKLSSKKIRKSAQTGDKHAQAAWKNYTSDIAIGLANIIAFVNPKRIALGGGMSSAGDFLIDAVAGRVDDLTTMVPRGTTEIVIAQLGNNAGQAGAAEMVFRGGLMAAATSGTAAAV